MAKVGSPSMRSSKRDGLSNAIQSSNQSKSIRLSTEQMKKTLESHLQRSRPEMEQRSLKIRNSTRNVFTKETLGTIREEYKNENKVTLIN